jgi:hypothetical protein
MSWAEKQHDISVFIGLSKIDLTRRDFCAAIFPSLAIALAVRSTTKESVIAETPKLTGKITGHTSVRDILQAQLAPGFYAPLCFLVEA